MGARFGMGGSLRPGWDWCHASIPAATSNGCCLYHAQFWKAPPSPRCWHMKPDQGRLHRARIDMNRAPEPIFWRSPSSSFRRCLRKSMIAKELVALAGVESGFAAFQRFLQVTETTNAGFVVFAGISGLLYRTCTRGSWLITHRPVRSKSAYERIAGR